MQATIFDEANLTWETRGVSSRSNTKRLPRKGCPSAEVSPLPVSPPKGRPASSPGVETPGFPQVESDEELAHQLKWFRVLLSRSEMVPLEDKQEVMEATMWDSL